MAGKRAELLSPAGDMERLAMALAYGADAVYLSGSRFGLRAAAGNFSDAALEQAVDMCRARGVRVYAACNAVMDNEDVRLLPPFLEKLAQAGVDAVIVSDLGALNLAKKHAPGLGLHVSTQAGVTNHESARAFYDMGASRIILARELTLGDIAGIREKTPPELELEAFVHGSMCVAFSGRCLLSSYLAGRDANRGACAQPCRWKYRLIEEKRPDQALEITEDGGTFLFNSRDLCMIDHIPELLAAGIDSLKIEGRQKSAYYAAVVTNAYRRAVDAAAAGVPLMPVWSREVYKVSHRPYSTGFYFDPAGPGQYYPDAAYFSGCDVVAVVEDCDGVGNARLTQRNKFEKGDALELLTPTGPPVPWTAEVILDGDGREIESAPHPMMALGMKLPAGTPKYSILRRPRPQGPAEG